MNNKRQRTLSQHFYDDEIEYIDEHGVHLKPGVHRLSYNTHIKPDELEEHINEIDLKVQKKKAREEELYTKEDGITEY